MRQSLFVVCLLALIVMLCGCGERKQYGAPMNAETSVATLKEIAQDPAAYKDKPVVLRGNYGFYCCPADFSYKEGFEVVAVAPQGFGAPKLKTGTPVTIQGIVRVGHPPEAEGETSGKAEEAAEFYIEAQGVTLR